MWPFKLRTRNYARRADWRLIESIRKNIDWVTFYTDDKIKIDYDRLRVRSHTVQVKMDGEWQLVFCDEKSRGYHPKLSCKLCHPGAWVEYLEELAKKAQTKCEENSKKLWEPIDDSRVFVKEE